jgi:translation initiation factor IF-3
MLCQTGATSRPFSCKGVILISNYPIKQGPQRPKNTNTDLVNERVRFPEVLLIGSNGEQLGKMSSREAYNIAIEQELDLLCVAPNATPPVCKIINYGKYRFEQQKKAKENKKKQHTVEIKEIQLTPQIGQHDVDTKAKAARRFLEEGNKVKVGVRYRGRQMAHLDVGEEVMNKFISSLEDIAMIEKAPSMDGRWLNAVIAPKANRK